MSGHGYGAHIPLSGYPRVLWACEQLISADETVMIRGAASKRRGEAPVPVQMDLDWGILDVCWP